MKATELFFKWYGLHYEPLVFLGDSMYWLILDSLASGEHPAIIFTKPSKKVVEWSVELTDFGKELLTQQAHWIESNGISRWFGGTHNIAKKNSERNSENQACWYWDDVLKTVVYQAI